jgi:ADP-heptose:LPS heptosyltransferase
VDFLDTARIIQGLDCVVSVDTSVLHLAGALGKKSFVLLSHRCDPRWNLDLTWYPSVKLLRQSYPGDWEGILLQAQTKIKELLDGRNND